jgi:hypothetical protein
LRLISPCCRHVRGGHGDRPLNRSAHNRCRPGSQRAAELANDADLRLNPPRTAVMPEPAADEPRVLPYRPGGRLPPPGSVLTRPYKGDVVQVKLLEHGFEYQGQVYKSLSAVAKAVTGSHCNGFLFFKLNGQGGDA